MKKILMFLLVSSLTFGATFVNPNTFKGSTKEKKAVVAWIQESVEKTYTAIGMADATTLRMMEKQELKSFQQLIKIDNKKLLTDIIKKYSSIGVDNYSTIWMMYQKEDEASKETLDW